MSSFTSPLVVSPVPGGKRWKLVFSFTYRVGSKDSDDKIVVRNGFVTDFASVPRLLWWLLPPWGTYGKAAVIHDYMYQTRTRTRKQADDIFLEAMEVLSVAKWKRALMYRAVRVFGGFIWKRKRGILGGKAIG